MKYITLPIRNKSGKKGKKTGIWQRHPFVIPVITFMILFFVSCAGLVVMNGETIGADDSKVVHLYVDGQTRIIPTRAQTVEEMLKKSGVELNDKDVVEPALDNAIIGQDFNVNVYRAKPVTVVDNGDGKRIMAKVIESSPRDIAKKAGLTIYPEDKVEFAQADNALNDGVIGSKVIVERSVPVNINLYGNNISTRTHATNIKELLEEKNIKLLDGDSVFPDINTPLSSNAQIFITSPGKHIANVEEDIPAPQEEVEDPNVLMGKTEVKEEGSPGKKVVTYEIEIIDGVEVGRRIIQEFVAVEPVKRVISKGTKIVISNPSENVKTGQRLAAERGWTGEEWYCLYQLWQKESGWNSHSENRSSGAYGIPQAYPGTKMSSAGSDWQTNPETQIKWGMGYIANGRYGTPCGAWQHSQARGWY